MPYNFTNVCVMVVDDNLPILTLTKSVLRGFGVCDIIEVKDADKAFDIFCDRKPDIVISDWVMEPEDGMDLTQKIRFSEESPNPHVPIILMTGFSELGRVIKARDGGVTEFLVKPFNARDLYKRIAQVIEKPRSFIKSPDFSGPDRRRPRFGKYYGPYRRLSDDEAKAKELHENPD